MSGVSHLLGATALDLVRLSSVRVSPCSGCHFLLHRGGGQAACALPGWPFWLRSRSHDALRGGPLAVSALALNTDGYKTRTGPRCQNDSRSINGAARPVPGPQGGRGRRRPSPSVQESSRWKARKSRPPALHPEGSGPGRPRNPASLPHRPSPSRGLEASRLASRHHFEDATPRASHPSLKRLFSCVLGLRWPPGSPPAVLTPPSPHLPTANATDVRPRGPSAPLYLTSPIRLPPSVSEATVLVVLVGTAVPCSACPSGCEAPDVPGSQP